MEYILSTYRQMERAFMLEVYELHKAFNFRTLWEGNDPLVQFRRVAVSTAQATGRLNGILQLTDVMKNIEDVETEAVKCFTNNIFANDIAKWSFDKTKNKAVSWVMLSKLYMYVFHPITVNSNVVHTILYWWQARYLVHILLFHRFGEDKVVKRRGANHKPLVTWR